MSNPKSGILEGYVAFFGQKIHKTTFFDAFLDSCAEKSKQNGSLIFDLLYLGWDRVSFIFLQSIVQQYYWLGPFFSFLDRLENRS